MIRALASQRDRLLALRFAPFRKPKNERLLRWRNARRVVTTAKLVARRPFLLSLGDASSLRSYSLRKATYRPATSASLLLIRIIAMAEATCLFTSRGISLTFRVLRETIGRRSMKRES